MVMAMLTLVSGVVAVSADCGVAGVGYQSQKWEKFDGTTSACDCDSKCCKSGLAGVSGYTRSRGTCYCQMDANPSQHTDVGSVSGRCSGNMVSNSTLNMGASVSRMPLSIEHTKTAEKVDQSWTCWHFTPSDNALINSGTSMAEVCLSHGSSFRFVKGGGLPGCGTCWCCHTSSTEAHESMQASIENTKTTEVVVKQEMPRKVKNEVGACFANRRVDCGFPGISSNQCTGYSCCYLKVSKGLSCTLPKECTDTGAMDSPKDCGWPGISMDQCNQRGCCYSHGAAAGGMSCWYAAGSEAMLNSTGSMIV